MPREVIKTRERESERKLEGIQETPIGILLIDYSSRINYLRIREFQTTNASNYNKLKYKSNLEVYLIS